MREKLKLDDKKKKEKKRHQSDRSKNISSSEMQSRLQDGGRVKVHWQKKKWLNGENIIYTH